jgi:SAM-dependent methyltransferase
VEASKEIRIGTVPGRIRSSAPWRLLRRVGFLRSSLYLAIELRRSWREPGDCSPAEIGRELARERDPWNYETSPIERERFRKQSLMIDAVRAGSAFHRGLEIGCAEGLYTEELASRCASLLVLDISPAALAHARGRKPWPASVRFASFDLRTDAIPGSFDLIVASGVLEYFSRPSTMAMVREKLVAALRPGGYLLVETTRCNPLVERAWWGRWLVRGKWINAFIARHPSLAIATQRTDEHFAISLFRKAATPGDAC